MPRECAVSDCRRDAHAGGYCAAHYHRFRRYGDPLITRRTPPAPCAVAGCERATVARGLCRRHYDRDRAGVPPEAPLDHARRQTRSEREALADLAHKLGRLGIERDHAVRFVVMLASALAGRARPARRDFLTVAPGHDPGPRGGRTFAHATTSSPVAYSVSYEVAYPRRGSASIAG
jgi:hypothetical protein